MKNDVGMAKHLYKSTETRDELSITLYLQSEIISVLSGCLSMPDATSLHPRAYDNIPSTDIFRK